MPRLQIKDNHNSLKKVVKEIEELKRMLEITTREMDQSLDEEMCRAYAEALQSPKATEIPKHSQHTSDSGTEDCQNDEPSLGSLGLFTGPKYFIKIKFCPSESNLMSLIV